MVPWQKNLFSLFGVQDDPYQSCYSRANDYLILPGNSIV
jgi:hypothetical protein